VSRPRASTIALIASSVATLAGCGQTRVVGVDRNLHVAISEYRLNPDSARVSAGVVTIVVRNYGRLAHNLVVAEGSQTTGSIKPLFPGQATTLSLNLAPGSYSMYSSMRGDQVLGTYGTLTVTP
jgi:plastocyanin